eukprot:scaffold22738_cov31-Tisochrysis_lutea.AAC.4
MSMTRCELVGALTTLVFTKAVERLALPVVRRKVDPHVWRARASSETLPTAQRASKSASCSKCSGGGRPPR